MLLSWRGDENTVLKGDNLVNEGVGSDHILHFVAQGQLYASQTLENGDRGITRLYFAGDFVGTANVPFADSVHTITAARNSVVFRIPNKQIVRSFEDYPRIAAMFYTFSALENAVLTDRLVALGRSRGIARLASFLLEVICRLEMIGQKRDKPFELHMTQAQIGEALGMTSVHVNRVFKNLQDQNMIKYEKGRITIYDCAQLEKLSNFQNRYDEIDREWFKKFDTTSH